MLKIETWPDTLKMVFLLSSMCRRKVDMWTRIGYVVSQCIEFLLNETVHFLCDWFCDVVCVSVSVCEIGSVL